GSPRFARRLLVGNGLLACLVVLLPSAALAGTTGKLSGRVVDGNKQPLVGVNVAVPGARSGAVTDVAGRYVVLNLPAGGYEVKFSMLGYGPVSVQGVLISADQTTPLDMQLKETPIGIEEVVVTAERPVVNLNLTSTLATVSREELESLPVQELQDVVNLQAGVVDGHFRGGRLGEVQYQVDGVSVNNSYDNKSSLKLDRSLLEEVQVISGTFDAEYGQAMSGVVNAVLRRGGDKLEWNAEVFAGGFLYPSSNRTVNDPAANFTVIESAFRPAGIQNYQLSVSGPTRLPNTTFLANARRYVFDDWVTGERRFRPTDIPDTNLVVHATGDGERVPLAFTREWSGLAKITNRSITNIEFNYQAIVNHLEGRRADYRFRLNPDGLKKQRTLSVVHGLDWTHTLGPSTFYTLAARQNYFDYQDFVFENVNDPRYDAAGNPSPPFSNYELGAVIWGVDFDRFVQTSDAMVLKGSYVSQLTSDQQIKLGAEFQWPAVRFGSPGHLAFTAGPSGQVLGRHENEPPDFPAPQVYHPVQGAAFAQEDVEWNDLRVRAGARVEYFDPRSNFPSDLANPANSISGVPQSYPVRAHRKVSVAPRIGISYPVTEDAALFFAYGHFYQMPALGEIFKNADYSILNELAAGDPTDYRVMGNPDIRPEQTVQYQFGYKQALMDWLGLDVNLFYKDIRDLLGVEFISTYNDAEYTRLTNVDFGNVIGFTLTLDQRRQGLISTSLDYTWQRAQGNASDPRETATRAEAGEDPRPRQIPFAWDQRHTFNLTVTLSRPQDFTVSTIVRAASGQPYTPTGEGGFGEALDTHSGRKPVVSTVDLRAEKDLRLGGRTGSLFGRVLNVFDTRFFNGFVFGSTGSPYYSRFPEPDGVLLADPSRFFGPRRIELGVAIR
ncbi:MAG TPA: TonB-dependent receptor, partial [Candidatus Limnocylindria bacterium]|nr:TonB-dependent receptor [Candidatus Limnocylindria bacterium]